MKYLALFALFISPCIASVNTPLPIDDNTVLVLNSFYFLFILVMFIVFGIEQVFHLFKRVQNA